MPDRFGVPTPQEVLARLQQQDFEGQQVADPQLRQQNAFASAIRQLVGTPEVRAAEAQQNALRSAELKTADETANVTDPLEQQAIALRNQLDAIKDLNPQAADQMRQALAQIRVQQFEMNRLKAQDAREERRLTVDIENIQADNLREQNRLALERARVTEGQTFTQDFFRYVGPDGVERTTNRRDILQNADNFVVGETTAIAGLRQRASKTGRVKLTADQVEREEALAETAQILGRVAELAPLDPDTGQRDFEKISGPFQGPIDRKLSIILGAQDSSEFDDLANTLSVTLQGLLAGIPSDKDQFILERTKMGSNLNPEINRIRFERSLEFARNALRRQMSRTFDQFGRFTPNQITVAQQLGVQLLTSPLGAPSEEDAVFESLLDGLGEQSEAGEGELFRTKSGIVIR